MKGSDSTTKLWSGSSSPSTSSHDLTTGHFHQQNQHQHQLSMAMSTLNRQSSEMGSTVHLLGNDTPGPGGGGGGGLRLTSVDRSNHNGYSSTSCTIPGFNGEATANVNSSSSISSSKGNYFGSSGCGQQQQQYQYHHHHHHPSSSSSSSGSSGPSGSANILARCCIYLTKGLNMRICAVALVIVTIFSMLYYNYYMDSSPIASFMHRDTRPAPLIHCRMLNNGKPVEPSPAPDHRSEARLRIDPKVLVFVETTYSRLGRDIAELLVYNRIK